VDGKVTVHMEGGDLAIEVGAGLDLVMTGPVEEVCAGRLSADLRRRLRGGRR
jgi:diaminopimelate epimerase